MVRYFTIFGDDYRYFQMNDRNGVLFSWVFLMTHQQSPDFLIFLTGQENNGLEIHPSEKVRSNSRKFEIIYLIIGADDFGFKYYSNV